MEPADRRRVVERHLEETVTAEELEELLAERDDPSVYIGYAPTGEMHIGHYTTIRKLVDFQRAGLSVTVLIADLHAYLDDEKTPWDLLDARSRYYQRTIETMVEATGGDPRAIRFERGSDFELEPPYTMDLYRLVGETTTRRAQRAGSEVVRQRDDPRLGGLLYTLMQSLDVAALDVDIAYGGIDQRGIYMLARETLPTLGYDKPICLFAPLLSGLEGGKMSASEAGSSVRLTDDRDAIVDKLNDAYCPAGSTEDNGILEYLKYLVFPTLMDRGQAFVIERPAEYGGDVVYEDYESLEVDFINEDLHPQDLKNAAAAAIAELIAPIRERTFEDPDVLEAAYPEQYG